MVEDSRVVSASVDVDAAPGTVFELIADPSRQPEWDGHANLRHAATGQRVRRVGDVFTMTLTNGGDRENHVVDFAEGRRIAWRPAPVGGEQPGHLWRFDLEPLADGRTRVTHTYDWSALTDEGRFERARATTSESLARSLSRLAAVAESGHALPALFAGLLVSDLDAAVAWCERLLGAPPVMRPHDDEAVFELGPGRSLYVERRAGAPGGGGLVTVFVRDLAAFVEAAAERGLAPASDEDYGNGVRKVTYRDPDGNEVGVGGASSGA